MAFNCFNLFTDPKKGCKYSHTKWSFLVGHQNPACLGKSEILNKQLSCPRAPRGSCPRESTKRGLGAHKDWGSITPCQLSRFCGALGKLTHTTLLFTEELGPNMLLSKCVGFSLLVRSILAGSSKSSKFPVAAAANREEREWGRREKN